MSRVEEAAGLVALAGFSGDENHAAYAHEHVIGAGVRADRLVCDARREECRHGVGEQIAGPW